MNVNVAKESAPVGSPSLLCCAALGTERVKIPKGNGVEAGKTAEKGKGVPGGFETKGKKSGATGSGVTGATAVNVVNYSGTIAHGHDFHPLAKLVRNPNYNVAHTNDTNETHVNRDHTITYALSPDSIKKTTNVDITVKTKDGARTSNPLCVVPADDVVTTLVPELGKAVLHAIDPLIDDAPDAAGATVTFYSGVLIFELEDNRVLTVLKESTDHTENGNTANLANSFEAITL